MNITNPLQEDRDNTWKMVAIALGILAYLSTIVLTGAHSYNLIVNAVAEDVRWIVAFGFIGLEINAVALPLAIHYWTTNQMHRLFAIVFYIVDFALLYANSIIDARMVSGGIFPAWGNWYLDNVAQVSPIITMAIWSILFMLDPSQRAKEKIKELIEYARQSALTNAIEYVNSNEFKQVIANNGNQIGQSVLDEAFGKEVAIKFDKQKQLEKQVEKVISGNGHSNF